MRPPSSGRREYFGARSAPPGGAVGRVRTSFFHCRAEEPRNQLSDASKQPRKSPHLPNPAVSCAERSSSAPSIPSARRPVPKRPPGLSVQTLKIRVSTPHS
ncbi:hypothetical protein HMPREF9440_01389 [Sutterella parvirubra YIT 11816]|uniref:Uncharacterized protein n=1 Tax=Sutterella parvirubra YIT 11816 TaxID=762967 RepID=H3KF71_9BURK|nr:hypothetical protein HMPREF9440_01389 [Sutterella parvirubra YIT 11816]